MQFEFREVWEPNYNGKSDICQGGEFPIGVAEDLDTLQPQNEEARFSTKLTTLSIWKMLKVVAIGALL